MAPIDSPSQITSKMRLGVNFREFHIWTWDQGWCTYFEVKLSYNGQVKLSRDHVSRPTFDEESHGDLYFEPFYRLWVELN